MSLGRKVHHLQELFKEKLQDKVHIFTRSLLLDLAGKFDAIVVTNSEIAFSRSCQRIKAS